MPVEVKAVTVEPSSTITYADKVGEVRGSQEVDLGARVGGILLKTHFEDGALVQEGQLLFSIDAREYRAQVNSARAQVASAEANLKAKVDTIASEHWKTELDDSTLAAQLARPRYLSSSELRSNIDYLKRNRLDAGKFERAYWSHWFYPYNVIMLCLATLPFAFGSLRSGGFGKRLFIGILIGIAGLLSQRLFADLADVYRFDVRLAYLFPPMLIWALCWGWIAKKI